MNDSSALVASVRGGVGHATRWQIVALNTQQLDPSDQVACPSCKAVVRFYAFSSMGNVCPHFYCDTCSNVFHRESDFDRIYGREPSQELLDEIAADLPGCPCGGRFVPGANPKCPSCGADLGHQSPPIMRLHDPHAIVIESALFCSEGGA
jgi:hypothetical protein